MAEILDFETTLFQALEEKTAWMDTSVLPSMLEDYRVEHSCVMNLINVLIQKGLIAPDPYKLDKKKMAFYVKLCLNIISGREIV